jgi:acyl dehydratase
MTHIREQAIRGLNVGDAFRVTRTFTDAGVRKFADISRDYNPAHFDERFAGVK